MSVSNVGYKYIKNLRKPLFAKTIRSLDAMAKFSKKISEMLKQDLVYLGLEKKESKKLQARQKSYIKAIKFIIY